MRPSETFLAAMNAMASGDAVAIAAFYSSATSYWDPLSGPLSGTEVAAYLASIGRRLDQFSLILDHVVEHGSTACIEWIQRSVVDGRPNLLRGASFVPASEGVILEQRDYFDFSSTLKG